MIGLSTSGSISFGWALVAGRNLVPRPAAGNTALRIVLGTEDLPDPDGNSIARHRYTIYSAMIDPGLLRDQMDRVRTALANRGVRADAELEQLATLEARRRRLIPELEGLKREQNAAADEVARAKRQGHDASHIFAANKARAQRLRQVEIEADQVEQQRASLLMTLPNVPHATVPIGSSADQNVEV